MLQKSCYYNSNSLRVIRKEEFDIDAHTEAIFKELGILKLNEIYLLQIGKLMYLYKNGLLPNSFNNMFLMVNQVCNHNGETNIPFISPRVKQFSFRYQGPKFFTLNS